MQLVHTKGLEPSFSCLKDRHPIPVRRHVHCLDCGVTSAITSATSSTNHGVTLDIEVTILDTTNAATAINLVRTLRAVSTLVTSFHDNLLRNWSPRQDSNPHPPRSKRGTLSS